jgi:hypothetical protein
MKSIVSIWHLIQLLAWAGEDTNAGDEHFLENLDGNDELRMRLMIRKTVLKMFKAYTSESKNMLKESFRYFLTTDDMDFRKAFETFNPPYDPPNDNPKKFFEWIWQELFPGEDWRLDDTSNYTVDNEVNTYPQPYRQSPQTKPEVK